MTVNKKNMINEETVFRIELTEENDLRGVTSGPWKQDGTTVTNEETSFEAGTPIIGYEANGISEWFVLGAKDGKLLITTNSCPETVTLSGREGYFKGVETLDEVSKKYCNPDYADDARSIRAEDINEITGFDPESPVYGLGSIVEYGNVVEYIWEERETNYGTRFLTCLAQNGCNGKNGGLHFIVSNVCDMKEPPKTDRIKVTFTSSCYEYSLKEYIKEGSAVYKMLFNYKSYWIASRYVACGSCSVDVGIRQMDFYGYMSGYWMTSTAGGYHTERDGVMPVVILNSGIKIRKDEKIYK